MKDKTATIAPIQPKEAIEYIGITSQPTKNITISNKTLTI